MNIVPEEHRIFVVRVDDDVYRCYGGGMVYVFDQYYKILHSTQIDNFPFHLGY